MHHSLFVFIPCAVLIRWNSLTLIRYFRKRRSKKNSEAWSLSNKRKLIFMLCYCKKKKERKKKVCLFGAVHTRRSRIIHFRKFKYLPTAILKACTREFWWDSKLIYMYLSYRCVNFWWLFHLRVSVSLFSISSSSCVFVLYLYQKKCLIQWIYIIE